MLPRELHLPRSPRSPPWLTPGGVASRRAEGPACRRGVSTTTVETQDAFHRIDPRPCDRVERLRGPFHVRARITPHRFRLARRSSLRQRLSSRATLPHVVGSPLGRTREAVKKMLLTDFCNRHYDTCTRGSYDSRACGFHRHCRAPRAAATHVSVDLSALRGTRATLPFGARSPESMRA